MYAKISVRSGGIVLREPNSKKGKQYKEYDIFSIPSDKINEKIITYLRVIRDNSIAGMISYLLGERRKINTLIDNDRDQIMSKQISISIFERNKPPCPENELENLDTSQDKHKSIQSFGNIQTFYERRDLVYSEKSLINEPNSNLAMYDWHNSSDIVSFFKDELTNSTGENSFFSVYKMLLNEYKSFKKNYSFANKFKNKNINNENNENTNNDDIHITSFLNSIDINEDDLIENINTTNKDLKEINNLIDKINEKINTALKAKKTNSILGNNFNDMPFYPSYIKLIREIKKSLNLKRKDFSLLKSAKMSCFDSSLMQPTHWLNEQAKSKVCGAPAYVLNLDFDIYITNLTEMQIKRFIKGPRIAYWGEGGTAFLELFDETPPAEAYVKNETIACNCSWIYSKTKIWYETNDKK